MCFAAKSYLETAHKFLNGIYVKKAENSLERNNLKATNVVNYITT